jgi:hypothetical protein
MVALLLKKYNLPDPVKETGDKIGVFKDKYLQELYDKLIAEGKKSLVDALKVGATIEDLDIADLEKALQNTDNRDIRLVYLNLMKGSRNHMRAFVRLLRRFGSDYKPQYISVEEFQKIVSSRFERGFTTATVPTKVNISQDVQNTSQNQKISDTYKPGDVLTGKVLKFEQRLGPRGRVLWWVADIQTPRGIYTVYLAPVWKVKNPSIAEGNYVEVKVYIPPMWQRWGLKNTFVGCWWKNKSNGWGYTNPLCPRIYR